VTCDGVVVLQRVKCMALTADSEVLITRMIIPIYPWNKHNIINDKGGQPSKFDENAAF
jgi:hypothetical protein